MADGLDRMNRLGPMFNMIGGISGLAALIGGALWVGHLDGKVLQHDKKFDQYEAVGGANQIKVNTEHLNVLEGIGTRALQAHIDMDTERVEDIKRRMKLVEEVSQEFRDVRADIRIINAKLDEISARLTKEENSNGNGKRKEP